MTRWEWAKARVEVVKAIVEIVALVIAGGWVLYEHGLQETRRRHEGEATSWAVLKLETSASPLEGDRWWVLARLRVKNDSKRPARPLLLSWWVKLPPPKDGKDPKPYKMWNEPGVFDDIRPGQETEFSWPIVIDTPTRAVFLRVELYFAKVQEGEECIIAPLGDGRSPDVATLHEQPRVCLRDESSAVPRCRGTADTLCSVELTEAIQALRTE